ncbi:helix-turn-helix domain-containing protein [Rhizobium sp. SAFR-030]|uniref:helix-turn-helix domain-containing protein n=1 Tax=Rhizobium sp. SAFR-030 TaxID=3387277 RepID=UPI003F81B0EF
MQASEPISDVFADPTDPVERVEFSADGTDPAGDWRRLFSSLLDWQPARSPSTSRPFFGKLTVYHLGFFLACHIESSGGRLSRTPLTVTRDDHDHFIVTIVVGGQIRFADQNARRMRPGDVSILDLRTPMTCVFSPGETIHLIIPRLFLPLAVAPPDPVAFRVLRPHRVASRFLEDLARMLVQMASYAERGEAMALASVLKTPITFCFEGPDASPSTATVSRHAPDLRRFIEDNLDRIDLNPAFLLKRFALSRTQMFRQFQASGGVETYIRRRRLRRSLVALADPASAHRQIGEIAYDNGFPDETHFSRLFKQAYGTTPRAYRRQARQGSLDIPAGVAGEPAQRLVEWLTQLKGP